MNNSEGHITLRKAEEEDLEAIMHLIHDTIRSCYPSIYPKKVVDFFIDYHAYEKIKQRMHDGYLSAIFFDNKLAGTGFLVNTELGGVYIHPKSQRKSLGSQLVLHLIQRAKFENLKRIWLDATPIAKPMYDKLGFALLGPRVDMVDDTELPYFKMEMKF